MDADFVEFVRRRGDHHLKTAVLRQTPAVRGEPAAASGTMDVDDQGRVRRLEVTFADNGHRNVMDIGDYGIPVTVSAPPAGQVVSKPD
ncbi:hypothetical protein ACQP2K_04425 [Microbispora siamensis]